MPMSALVAIVCLIAAGACLIAALFLAFADRAATEQLRQAVQIASAKVNAEFSAEPVQAGDDDRNPAQPRFGNMDFRALANLAEAVDKLNRSGRFLLIASLAFAAISAVAAGVEPLAGAVPRLF
jgi:Na+(H+)/acetate symporter ActP